MRPGCRSGCGCSWREGCRVVGDGVAVAVCPDAVRGVVAHGVRSCLDRAGGCPSPRLEAVGACWPVCEPCTLDIYIIGKTNYFNAKTKNYLFLFGYIKISLYLCSTKTIKPELIT